MNRPLLAVLLAATALTGPFAWAQDQHGHDDHQGGAGRPAQAQHQAHAQHQPANQGRPQAHTHTQRQPPTQHQPQAQRQPQGHAQAHGQGQGGGFSYGGRRHDRVRASQYSYPQGYGYRRWGVGQSLPMLFLSQSFFFDSYADYGIGAPPYGYRWVRYGPDLLLVSRRTGSIRQVIYGVFY